MKKRIPYTSYDEDLQQELKNPKFRAAYEIAGKRLEIAYEIAFLRQKSRLTQKELAKKLKISQSTIARIEHGGQNLTIETLFKISQVFGKKLQINFV